MNLDKEYENLILNVSVRAALSSYNFIGKKALMLANKKCKTWGIRVKDGVALKGETIKKNANKIL